MGEVTGSEAPRMVDGPAWMHPAWRSRLPEQKIEAEVVVWAYAKRTHIEARSWTASSYNTATSFESPEQSARSWSKYVVA